jgi:hypothetical protein
MVKEMMVWGLAGVRLPHSVVVVEYLLLFLRVEPVMYWILDSGFCLEIDGPLR